MCSVHSLSALHIVQVLSLITVLLMHLGFLFVFVFLLYGTCSSRVGYKKAKLYYLCFIDFPCCSPIWSAVFKAAAWDVQCYNEIWSSEGSERAGLTYCFLVVRTFTCFFPYRSVLLLWYQHIVHSQILKYQNIGLCKYIWSFLPVFAMWNIFLNLNIDALLLTLRTFFRFSIHPMLLCILSNI